MTEFAFNNAKNITTEFTFFEQNFGFNHPISYKKDVNHCSKSKAVDKIVAQIRKLTTICQQNLHHAQEFQKRF